MFVKNQMGEVKLKLSLQSKLVTRNGFTLDAGVIFPIRGSGGGVCLSAQPIRDVNHVSCAQSDYLLYMLSIMTLAVSLLELGYFHLYMTMSGKRDVIS